MKNLKKHQQLQLPESTEQEQVITIHQKHLQVLQVVHKVVTQNQMSLDIKK